MATVIAEQPEIEVDCPECLAKNLSWLLSRASFALASEVSRAFGPLDLSPRGYHVLAAASSGDRTQSELAELVGLDKTTMVTTVDELEQAGLAERRPSPEDRRARVIAVTRAGKRKVSQGEQLIAAVQADVLDSLPAAERKVFLESLGSLVKGRLAEPIDCPGAPRRREPRAPK
jgi:DNA-binding MarR family transcriptional regulator